MALKEQVYLFKMAAKEENVVELMNHPDSFYSALRFSGNGNYLAVGDLCGSVSVMDVAKEKLTTSQKHTNDRLTAISWMSEQVFSTGCQNGEINTVDVRTKSFVSSFKHPEGVCGLTWSTDDPVLASGGNDFKVHLWDLRK